jgi:hypothetical protein
MICNQSNCPHQISRNSLGVSVTLRFFNICKLGSCTAPSLPVKNVFVNLQVLGRNYGPMRLVINCPKHLISPRVFDFDFSYFYEIEIDLTPDSPWFSQIWDLEISCQFPNHQTSHFDWTIDLPKCDRFERAYATLTALNDHFKTKLDELVISRGNNDPVCKPWWDFCLRGRQLDEKIQKQRLTPIQNAGDFISEIDKLQSDFSAYIAPVHGFPH